ncbi:MAG: hypothetical protein HN413_04905 [Chloroflexi bacterium]|mgnify:CR=1 FL=1|nr:hypothetical protein [Chloroflexota bacterium]
MSEIRICVSGLGIIVLIFLVLVALSFLRWKATLNSRDRLRWQFKTRHEVEKALENGMISEEAARQIISVPEYGAEWEHHPDKSRPTREDRTWEGRKKARLGWEAVALIMFLAIGIFLVGVFVAVAIISGVGLLGVLERSWPMIYVFACLIITALASLVLFLWFTWRVLGTTRQMMKYN